MLNCVLAASALASQLVNNFLDNKQSLKFTPDAMKLRLIPLASLGSFCNKNAKTVTFLDKFQKSVDNVFQNVILCTSE